jgi:hypothetical protein
VLVVDRPIIRRSTSRKQRTMILQRTHNAGIRRPLPNGLLEDDSLVISLAISLGLDTVDARWALLTTLDASLSTS